MTSAVPASPQSTSAGEARLRFLPDGHIKLQADRMFLNADWDWAPHADLLDSQGLLVMSMGSFLIEIGGVRALVDLGLGDRRIDVGALSGGRMQGEMVGGDLLAQLAAIGLVPEQIDVVLITHLHDEHVGWLLDPSCETPTLTFPRARHHVGRREWSSATDSTAVPSPAAPTQAQLDLLRRHVELLDDGDEPLAGVTAIDTPGHTPGHMSYVVHSGDERVIVIGDVVHSPVEFIAPELEFIGDEDRPLAQRTRRTIFAELAAPATITAGVHFPTDVFTRWDPQTRTFTPDESGRWTSRDHCRSGSRGRDVRAAMSSPGRGHC